MERLRDEAVGGGLSRRWTTEEELHDRCTRAVADTDGTSKLDAVQRVSLRPRELEPLLSSYVQVSGGEVVALDELPLFVDDLIDTKVRVEVGLNVIEESDRSIGTSATADGSASCVVKQDAVM